MRVRAVFWIFSSVTRFALACAAIAAPFTASANNVNGAWSPVTPWPLIAVHAVLMPDGRVLSYGTTSTGQQTGVFIYDVWDPAAGLNSGHTTLPNQTGIDIFCSSQVALPGGSQVFIAGGDNWTGTSTTNTGNSNSALFTLSSNTLTRANDLNRARWYSSSITLLNGETYVQGGSGGTDRPEVRTTSGNFRLLTGANTGSLDFTFPRNFVAPDGRVFGYDSHGRMYYVNTSGAGAIAMGNQFTGPTGSDASAAMFRPGRILQFGGNSSGALIIDINGATPSLSLTGSLSSRRRLVNATILADGKVLATGGSDVWNEMTGVNYSAEIWNPDTGQWTRGANAARARLYHSNALLMPDASVLVLGGGAPGPQNNTNVEVYYPPYLYNASGNFATRPVIQGAPTTIDVGETFEVQLGSAAAISRVALIKMGSASHSFNFEQRFAELTFHQDGNSLMVQAPTRAADAPPGFYLLFVLNSAGTPSVARIARVPVAPVVNPAITPVLTNPGARSGEVGTPLTLQLSATDPNGDLLTYSASGLPPGLAVNATAGTISGTPSAGGTYNVVATASDGVNTDSENFVWTIAQGPPFVLNPLPPPAPSTAGSTVTFTASVTGGSGLQYQWDFGDGSPATAYSSSPSVQHQFAQPGIYYVMVTVRNGAGTTQAATLMQLVHWPLTPERPRISGNIAFDATQGAPGRFWVVNQDHDSVSAFEAGGYSRLATVAVGTAPRALAVRPNGEVWVTNKLSASISVIDPSTLTVSRTIAMPFASQPFGIAIDPDGNAVYVVLESLGRLLKLDAGSGAVLASANVGPGVRHVSVNADGSRIFVSRFITPPLPGESTSAVQTVLNGQPVGGEVLVVNAQTLGVLDTVVLRVSDKPDFENQGRGVPNYLGAVAISPDGRLAWVPSKQDNIQRGPLRDGLPLNFQSTVRAISSRLDLVAGSEDYPRRIDHDNSGVASAVAFDRLGVFAFVALETSREVAVVDAHAGYEILRFAVGRAPQGLALSDDGNRLFVNNFMDRTVGVYDLTQLLTEGVANVPLVTNLAAYTGETLSATVLQGKRLFYDARDTRLAADAYISCASCHNDGGHDGRTWDLASFGEGLRNTVNLRGRAGSQGFLHWSNNFDEVQDFEGQIRSLSGGTGLMANSAFNSGTRNQPLGTPKAGISADLDALAAYVASLNSFSASPARNADGSLTAAAVAGRAVFVAKNCAACHGGAAFTNSAGNNPQDIGTMNADSGNRLGGTLAGIDVPTLRDAWATAPYLHRGQAPTLGEAIRAHVGVSVTDAELGELVAYVSQIGGQEATAPEPPPAGGTGAFQQAANGTVSMEAEHFSASIGNAPNAWIPVSPAGASGGAALRAPASEQPRVEYQVNFTRTGTHYVYVRSYGSSGSSDSVFVGFDGNWATQFVAMSPRLSWQWEGPIAINVTTTGIHTVGLTRRETDAQADKIVILPTATVPTGLGPAESSRDGSGNPPQNSAPTVDITAPAGAVSVVEGASVSFAATASDDEDGNLGASVSWSSSRDGLIGQTASFTTAALSVGTHTITASVMDSDQASASDSVTVTVTAVIPPGGTGAFQQAANGTVSMEAEHFSASIGNAPNAWIPVSPAGASGGAAVRAPASEQPRLEYQVNFTRTGTQYVYVRAYGSSGSSDSVHVGFDGNWTAQYVQMKPLLSWEWEGPIAINVTSTGVHTVGLTRRETDAQADKIVILPTATVPTGLGPAESSRDE